MAIRTYWPFFGGAWDLEFAPPGPLVTQPLGKRGGMGHWGGTLGGTTEGVWVGGGITSDAVGSWKVMFSSA